MGGSAGVGASTYSIGGSLYSGSSSEASGYGTASSVTSSSAASIVSMSHNDGVTQLQQPPPPGTASAGHPPDIPPAISPRTDKSQPLPPPPPPPLHGTGAGSNTSSTSSNSTGTIVANTTTVTTAIANSTSSNFSHSASYAIKNQNCDSSHAAPGGVAGNSIGSGSTGVVPPPLPPLSNNSSAGRPSSCENSPVYPSSPKIHLSYNHAGGAGALPSTETTPAAAPCPHHNKHCQHHAQHHSAAPDGSGFTWQPYSSSPGQQPQQQGGDGIGAASPCPACGNVCHLCNSNSDVGGGGGGAGLPNNADLGPIPHSPHVNVPNTHNVLPPMPPPPIPPRVKRKESSTESSQSSQIRQAPDAPTLPPRDVSPPPLPPRTHTQSHYQFGVASQGGSTVLLNYTQPPSANHPGVGGSYTMDPACWNHHSSFHMKDESTSSSSSSSTLTRDNLNQHNHHQHQVAGGNGNPNSASTSSSIEQRLLMLPHTSTIMMRRNSAMDRASKENIPNLASSSSLSSGLSAIVGGGGGTPGSGATMTPGPPVVPSANPGGGGSVGNSPSAVKNKSVQNSPISSAGGQRESSHQPQLQGNVLCRRASTNISPRFSPGETTPKLPPKPKQSNLNSDRTMFPYPSTN